MLIVFIVLIVGPLVAGKYLTVTIPMQLAQPTGLNRNDTISSETGTAIATGAAGTAAATSSAAGARKMLVRNASW
jgi:1,3-beta-glucan synthase